MDNKHYFPKYLNALPQFLWWELDEFMILTIGITLGVMAEAQFIGAGLGFIAMKIYSKLKRSKQPGFFKHYLYSKGLYEVKGKYPEYWKKELMM